MTGWKDVERPAYFGGRRNERYAEYDSLFGPGNWRLVWKFGPLDLNQNAACMLYEDAYFTFLGDNLDVLDRLVTEASNVYDDDPSNVLSEFDYAKQETTHTHIQDIAIRRSVVRHCRWFEGTKLIQIRDSLGTHPLSMTLSPGQVPFHLPDMILTEPKKRGKNEQWYKEYSVEDFWQRNRWLQARI